MSLLLPDWLSSMKVRCSGVALEACEGGAVVLTWRPKLIRLNWFAALLK